MKKTILFYFKCRRGSKKQQPTPYDFFLHWKAHGGPKGLSVVGGGVNRTRRDHKSLPFPDFLHSLRLTRGFHEEESPGQPDRESVFARLRAPKKLGDHVVGRLMNASQGEG